MHERTKNRFFTSIKVTVTNIRIANKFQSFVRVCMQCLPADCIILFLFLYKQVYFFQKGAEVKKFRNARSSLYRFVKHGQV